MVYMVLGQLELYRKNYNPNAKKSLKGNYSSHVTWISDFRTTVSKWITSISIQTITQSCVINRSAFSVQTTSSRTRISTFVSNTSEIRWAIWTDNTFRATSLVRITHVILDTSTRSYVILFTTYCVTTARWWYARICGWQIVESWGKKQRVFVEVEKIEVWMNWILTMKMWTYKALWCTERMDLQCIHLDKHTSVCGSQRSIQHWERKNSCKGLYISYSCMLNCLHTRYYLCILDDNSAVLQCIQANMYKRENHLSLYIANEAHKAMVHKDSYVQSLEELQIMYVRWINLNSRNRLIKDISK